MLMAIIIIWSNDSDDSERDRAGDEDGDEEAKDEIDDEDG
jgi:hypothetical protein